MSLMKGEKKGRDALGGCFSSALPHQREKIEKLLGQREF